VNPFPFILSAPSGGGKTTIAKELLRRRDDVGYSVSCTTRLPRAGEADGRDYHFVSQIEFESRRDRGEFAEWAEVHGRLYGTLRREVERVLESGKHCIMDIDVQGALQFSAAFPDSVLVFVLPPSAEALLARLTARKSEDRRMLAMRLQGAREELRAVGLYHYVVVNDELERAVEQVSSIIDAESVRHDRVQQLDEQIARLIAGLERTIGDYHTAT
jgi:guanylate kinase